MCMNVVFAATSYSTNYGDDDVSVVDLDTFKEVARIATDNGPNKVIVVDDMIVTANTLGNSVTFHDKNTYQILGVTTDLEEPFDLVSSADNSTVYVTQAASDTIALIDTRSFVKTLQMEVGTGPTGIIRQGDLLFVSNLGSGTLTIIDSSIPKVIAIVTMPSQFQSPNQLDFSHDGRYLYFLDTKFNTVRRFDTFSFDLDTDWILSTRSTTANNDIIVGSRFALVSTFEGDQGYLQIFDTTTQSLVKELQFQSRLYSLAFAGQQVYATFADGTLRAINIDTDEAIAIAVGEKPRGLFIEGEIESAAAGSDSTSSSSLYIPLLIILFLLILPFFFRSRKKDDDDDFDFSSGYDEDSGMKKAEKKEQKKDTDKRDTSRYDVNKAVDRTESTTAPAAEKKVEQKETKAASSTSSVAAQMEKKFDTSLPDEKEDKEPEKKDTKETKAAVEKSKSTASVSKEKETKAKDQKSEEKDTEKKTTSDSSSIAASPKKTVKKAKKAKPAAKKTASASASKASASGSANAVSKNSNKNTEKGKDSFQSLEHVTSAGIAASAMLATDVDAQEVASSKGGARTSKTEELEDIDRLDSPDSFYDEDEHKLSDDEEWVFDEMHIDEGDEE